MEGDANSAAFSAECALNEALFSLGFEGRIRFCLDPEEKGADEAIVSSAEVVFDLIRQRRADIEFRQKVSEERLRMQSDVSIAEARSSRLEKELEERKREVAEATRRELETEKIAVQEIEKLRMEKQTMIQEHKLAKHRQTQLAHEARKHERANSKLQERLNDLLTEKKKTATNADNMIGKIQRGASGRKSTTMPAKEQQFYKTIVGSFEARQKELVLENGDLRASLRALEIENRNLLNQLMEEEEVVGMRENECSEGMVSALELGTMKRELLALRERVNDFEDAAFEDEPPEY